MNTIYCTVHYTSTPIYQLYCAEQYASFDEAVRCMINGISSSPSAVALSLPPSLSLSLSIYIYIYVCVCVCVCVCVYDIECASTPAGP